jgi:hypothetical protein
MKNISRLVAFCSILLALTSCGKEKSIDTLGITPGGSGSGSGNGNGNGNGTGTGGGTSNGTEVGNWKFASMHVITSQTMDFSTAGVPTKVITTSDYITDNNSGNVKFDATTMFTTDIAFSVNSTSKTLMYSNGLLLTSQESPFVGTMPPSSSTAAYKKIGTDSLYFSAGVVTGISSNGSVETRPAGYKLKWDGDKMYMTLNYTETSTQDMGGVMANVITKINSVTTLQKQ